MTYGHPPTRVAEQAATAGNRASAATVVQAMNRPTPIKQSEPEPEPDVDGGRSSPASPTFEEGVDSDSGRARNKTLARWRRSVVAVKAMCVLDMGLNAQHCHEDYKGLLDAGLVHAHSTDNSPRVGEVSGAEHWVRPALSAPHVIYHWAGFAVYNVAIPCVQTVCTL